MKKRKDFRRKYGGALVRHRDAHGVRRVRHQGRLHLDQRHGSIHVT